MFDADRAWRLSPQVALRPEPFGALAYHYGNRRLTFLKTPLMVTAVRALEAHPTARAALAAAGVPETQQAAYENALASLADSEVIVAG